jgi:signal transduction histidine kinase
LKVGLEKFWALVGSVSVRTKILGIVLALTITLGLAVTVQVRATITPILITEVDGRGHSVVSDLAARSERLLQNDDLFGLRQLLVETVANHPDVQYAFVVDPTGNVLAHTFEADLPNALLTLDQIAVEEHTHHLHYENYDGRVHDFSLPIRNGQGAIIRLGVSEARIQTIIDDITRAMLITTVLVALAGVLAASLLTWVLTRPILDLVETTRQVQRGNLSARAPHWADDEIGNLANAFNDMITDLESSQHAIADKEAARTRLLARLINAQEEERKRIARELHDGVGQALTSLIVGLKILEQGEEQQASNDRLAELRHLTSETLEMVRLLSRQLRPSALDDLGLAAALDRYMAEFANLYPDLTVDLHCQLPERLPGPVAISLYRIIQEAMTNAARHSQATVLSVLVSRRKNYVQAIIEDNGHGFDVEAAQTAGSSVGVHGMAERAELLDGRLQIESNSEGTTVYVEIPV